ncbi:MAG: glucose-6-phosphate dehydrogenase assembly protein OpcA [Opitutaceae bacterium]|nr:glucose-6-phosphate dehydrogenase assembly protein OpcA [Opitutaceae bacterium]
MPAQSRRARTRDARQDLRRMLPRPHPSDARCCEFVLLSYPFAARRFLESQVSICLTPDLPVYYWAHRFTNCGRMADYQYLLTKTRRFLFDSAAAPAEALSYPWPRPETVRDLAYARLLPIRQVLGQFLARHPPAELVTGLREVIVSHGALLAAEGAALLRWTAERLQACGAAPGFATSALVASHPDALQLQLRYEGPSDFIWSGHLASGSACLSADFGDTASRLTTPISLLPPEAALADAMFF